MANSPKYRDYFLTINEGAKCYEDVLDIIKELNFKLYAYIVHDKDEIMDENGNKTGEKKPTHKHVMVELKNPVSFNAMQNRFQGAHIIVPKYKKSAYQYLVHNSPNSRGVKYQYDTTEIISNDLPSVEYIIETETSETFQQNRFLTYIVEGVVTAYQFVKRFGLDAYKQYWGPYSAMLAQRDIDEQMQMDIIRLRNKLRDGIIENYDDDLPF